MIEKPAMHPSERVSYSPIVERPPLRLPGDLRLIVWLVVNVEWWQIERAMPRQILPAPTGAVTLPDVANWSWHEYGMRVGFWRMKRSIDERSITPTLSINAGVCDAYPRIAEAALDSGWEFMGHSYFQAPMHSLKDQSRSIRETVERINRFTGRQTVGWLGPGLTQTYETPDLLALHGIRYIADWVFDDEPQRIATLNGPLVTLPYTLDLNDISNFVIDHHDAGIFAERARAHFDRLYQESRERPKFVCLAVHPYLSGVPSRIAAFEQILDHMRSHAGVAFWTGEEIWKWYEGGLTSDL